jgi:NADH:ubiquinone oxidoreductase subunit 2 (subunit N)
MENISVVGLLNRINAAILNPLIILAFAIALLVFFWGIFQFISSETADNKREEGKKKILWGIFGMFIMVSAYGLIYLILATFSIDAPPYLGS